MLRERLNQSLKTAVLAKEECAVATIRLILATLKDRDIAERGKGNHAGLTDEQIVDLLQAMIKQRRESVEFYMRGKRPDLADRETEEIKVIENFLPPQMNDHEVADVVSEVIDELGAVSLKDMGRTMGLLRERYAGRMDFSKASVIARQHLA
jgi:hypothetical protein